MNDYDIDSSELKSVLNYARFPTNATDYLAFTDNPDEKWKGLVERSMRPLQYVNDLEQAESLEEAVRIQRSARESSKFLSELRDVMNDLDEDALVANRSEAEPVQSNGDYEADFSRLDDRGLEGLEKMADYVVHNFREFYDEE